MAAYGEGGVLMQLLNLSGSRCGNILGGDGRSSANLLDSIWVMDRRSSFVMMCGAGIRYRRQRSRSCISISRFKEALVVDLTCSILTTYYNGTTLSLD